MKGLENLNYHFRKDLKIYSVLFIYKIILGRTDLHRSCTLLGKAEKLG